MKKRGRKLKETPESIKREFLEVTDEDCKPIGILTREEIHKNQFCHKAIHIFLFNEKNEIYLQKKADTMDENPGLWSSSVSGHVRVGESFLTAAQRELKEELSIKVKLEEVFKVKPSENTGKQCIVLFEGRISKEPHPNPLEIKESKFFTKGEVEALLQRNPEMFTPAFRFLWKLYWENRNQKFPKES
ncbi:MAG: NUDIX domain-containing protein [Thermodesulfobacteriaceae bacterium]|nr:NUDIX domain-containing protein [Thermodesulfobacteriaceae bacterium]